jgi:carboxyl-terminal processing protease
MMSISRFQAILAGACLVIIGVVIGRSSLPPANAPLFSVVNGQREISFPTFWETWDKLHQDFINPLDDKKLLYGAVSGMVAAAGDPYTSFQDPETNKQFQETLSGSFSGIGVEIGLRGGFITVIAPLKDSPAQKAGIKAEDIIVAIDKKPISSDTSIDQVVQSIRGPKGKAVALAVVHKNDNAPTDISIVRDTIKVESVRLEMVDGAAHITITSFNSDTAQRFKEAAQSAVNQHAKGIILDMRDNPGGFLQAAVDISSQFLDPGTLVVSEKGKDSQEYRTSGRPLLKGLPVVVLINKGSASASEIVAGALLDDLHVPTIGTTSFGKGSVQQLLDLSDGSSLKVTIAKWYTPSGRSINEQGIEPTIPVDQGKDATQDPQLDRAKQELQKTINH